MSPELRTLLVIAIIGGALLGAVLALLEPAPVPVIIVRSDPAAYEIAGVMEEARQIIAEAADDAR